jgi:phenylacetate-CoA ligase
MLAEASRLKGLDPAHDFPYLRAFLVAGEMLSDARKARLAAAWNARVFNLYGCTEAGNIAADCEAGRLHLSWDHFVLEVLDDRTWEPVPPGEMGTAVLTTLTRQAMPLLRFVLGDFLRFSTGPPCPCGRTAPTLEHHGRDLNCFAFGGRRYFVRDLEERLLTAPVQALGNLWVIDVRPGAVCFRVEAEQPDAALYRRLERQLRDELGLPLVIEPVSPGALLDRTRLTKVEPVHKPRVVGCAAPDARPLTLDDLM